MMQNMHKSLFIIATVSLQCVVSVVNRT